MNLLVIIVLALTPAIFWMWWYYRKDVYDKEPMRLLALVFVLSAPLSILCGLFEFTIDGGSQAQLSHKSGLLLSIVFYFGVVGVVEEAAKFAVVMLLVYRHHEFNEPMDGIIYATASALGFATLENFFYMLDQGVSIILLRGPVSTLGHILFSALWGAAIGLARWEAQRARRQRIIAGGLILGIVAHGTFDVLISLGTFFPDLPWLSLLALPYLAILYFVISGRIAHALHISSFNPRNAIQRLREGHSEAVAVPIPRYVPNPNAYRFRDQFPADNPDSHPPSEARNEE